MVIAQKCAMPLRASPPRDHDVLKAKFGWLNPPSANINHARSIYRYNILGCGKPPPPQQPDQPTPIDEARLRQPPFQRYWSEPPPERVETPIEAEDPEAAERERQRRRREALVISVKKIFQDRQASTGRSVARVVRHFDDGNGCV